MILARLSFLLLQVLQRQLPRPVSLDSLPAPKAPGDFAQMSYREKAEAQLQQELSTLLKHDNAAYPIKDREKESKKDKKASKAAAAAAAAVVPLEDYNLEELQGAELLLEEEMLFVKGAMGHKEVEQQEYVEAFETVYRDMIWLPGSGKYGRSVNATPGERLESVRVEHEQTRAEMVRQARKAQKLEQKANIVIQGLQQRDEKLQQQLGELVEQVQNAGVELACFKALREGEQRAGPERLERVRELLGSQQEREKELQLLFKSLTRERNDLREAVVAAAAAVAAGGAQ